MVSVSSEVAVKEFARLHWTEMLSISLVFGTRRSTPATSIRTHTHTAASSAVSSTVPFHVRRKIFRDFPSSMDIPKLHTSVISTTHSSIPGR